MVVSFSFTHHKYIAYFIFLEVLNFEEDYYSNQSRSP
jgi:hypothetical protein